MIRKAKCRHRRTTHRSWVGSYWWDSVHGVNCTGWISPSDAAVVCKDCGEWLSLGPARDDGPHTKQVAIEVRAAELAADPTRREACEDCGWRMRSLGGDRPPCCVVDAWHAGYLARCIHDHTEQGGEG